MVRYMALKGLYELEKTIGCGGFAKVKLGTHIATGEKVAIKIMDKSLLGDNLPRVKLEIKALKTLSHENICKLYQVLETETHYFLVIEYCSGGELFDHIVEKNRLTESESRIFFRQIVSAVVYLHSLGYAHRDLKPENILLDKNQNLKLIDFGLCAKPEGGIGSLLQTSCGSPTYAAPELVSGKTYFGPEVDVWAMGVLLYALLAGSLPFYDTNVDSLYKKILNGQYEEPEFMSIESKSLIRSMLQTDPKKRITVKELLSHPWLTLGIFLPVQIRSVNFKKYDCDCVVAMANHYKVSHDDMWKYLKKWHYDYYTATYMLLLTRKKRGASLKLSPLSLRIPLKLKMENETVKPPPLINPTTPTDESAKTGPDLITPDLKTPRHEFFKDTPDKDLNSLSPSIQKSSDVICSMEFLEPRKPLKRVRSPALDDDNSPVPTKKPTPGKSTPRTPKRKRLPSQSDGSGSARRVFGSIERSLYKVKHALGSKKEHSTSHPIALTSKELCNVSTTQCTDPEYVINKLSKSLEQKGILCERKGFTLRGKLEPNILDRFGGCSFELEICYLPNLGPQAKNCVSNMTPTKSILKNGLLNTPTQSAEIPLTPTSSQKNNSNVNPVVLVGIRRKRLKGDSWCYKKVCEEVLALTATELKLQIVESSV